MTKEDFQRIAPTLPIQPGIYKFIDGTGTVLYVGKAKNLKNRLSSYFSAQVKERKKTRTLVKNAVRIEYTIVETETDALLLENTLIKKLQPRYNVMLKDGKSYSYIRVRNEKFARVFITRRVERDGSTYFGPYTSKSRLKIILDLIKSLFPLRPEECQYNTLTNQGIQNGKYKVCTYYHVKRCLGGCVGLETEKDYDEKIVQVKNMLRGNFGAVKTHFKKEMQKHAENLEFEKAQEIKEKLRAFEDYQGKSTVVNQNIHDVDVFSITTDEKNAYVNYIKVVNGAIINTFTQEMTKNLNEEESDLLAYVIPQLREQQNSIAPEIIVPMQIALPDEVLKITIPKIGDKKKLLELSEKNVRYFQLQKQKQALNQNRKQTSAERILRTLQSDLNMNVLPLHIECFDNSNIQGNHPVASCVVFRNAKPAKKDYRHFNIKTVQGPDDFASMEEVVFRRYRRLLNEDKPLPQLIVIDGGKGQLSAAVSSLEKLNILNKITIIGIAKKLEEIYFPNDSIPLYISKKSESLKLIQQIRNEAHRFAITFHRNQRSRNFTTTELTEISGVGAKTAEKLLRHFKSVRRVREANVEELASVVGKGVAEKIVAYWVE